MRKFGFLLIAVFFLLLTGHVSAQYYHHKYPPPKSKMEFPAPHVNPYAKKKDTVKFDIYAVDTLRGTIPMARSLFHDRIDQEQRKADIADGREDSLVRHPTDTLATRLLTNAILYEVDKIQSMIENIPAKGRDEVADNQQRIGYLRAVWEMLRFYNSDHKPDPVFYKNLVDNMRGMLIAINEDTLMAFARKHSSIYTLDNIKEFATNHADVRAYIYTAIGRANPKMMIKRLSEFAKDTFAGEIIKADAAIEPDVIFNYAMSTTQPLKNAVYNTRDPLVQAIVKIARDSKAPLKTFPFLSDVYYDRKTVSELDTIAGHPDLYFENLVRLKMGNDSIGKRSYNEELTYRALNDFVRPMNALHEEKDAVRFRCIDSLSPTSLYYLMVYGQDEIYTSSFLGTFKRMMERMKPMHGDQLLDTLHYDRFRTFIRMCAGYNTLSDFLGTIDDSTKTTLMSNFIAGLEKGSGDDLEDAVDVADAFGSIRDSALSAFLEKQVKENYELSFKEKSGKGVVIYGIMAMLFEDNKISGSDTGASVASSRLHLPPINKVLYKDLVNDSGIIYQQVFFFGDKDGQDSYNSYMAEFKKDKNWKVITDSFWTVISSTTGKRIVTYANRPLDEPADEDAQDMLARYLDSCGIHPTIMIHRGHSYHLPVTLEKLTANVKIVILGSCGGYHNLSKVLDHSPDAHIISSKQTGTMVVNGAIIKSMNARLLQGRDVNWIDMWQELDEYFLKKPDAQDKFSDYVPPYKNLGAIFIKAYRKMMTKPPVIPKEKE